jgi:hypothetical protein
MAGLSANVEAIAVLFNTLSDAQRGNTPQTTKDCLKRCQGWGPLRGIGGWGDRATAPIQHIWVGVFPGCVADRYKNSKGGRWARRGTGGLLLFNLSGSLDLLRFQFCEKFHHACEIQL